MKRKMYRSVWIGILCFVVITAVTIVYSVIPVVIDFGQLNSSKFISNLMINYGLSVLMILAMLFTATSLAKEKEDSEYNKSLNACLVENDELRRRKIFCVLKQYCIAWTAQQKQEALERMLYNVGLTEKHLELDVPEVLQLFKEKRLSSEQKQKLIKIKQGKIAYDKVTPDSVKCKYDENRAGKKFINRKKEILLYKGLSRFFATFLVSALFMSIVVSSVTSDTKTALIDTAGRIITILSAGLSGFLWGMDLVKEDIRLFDVKTDFLQTFFSDYDTGAFKPILEKDVMERILKGNDKSDYIEVTEEELEELEKMKQSGEDAIKSKKK